MSDEIPSAEPLSNPPPRKGDALFRGDLPDWHNNACLSGTGQGDPVAYVEGYRRGAEILVHFVNDNGRDQEFLVYPILFLYRHHLELAMKRIIRRLPRLLYRELTSNETGQLRQHSLTGLWQALKPMVSSIYKAVDWPAAKSEDLAGADDYVRQLSEIDPDSESFRYPFGKNGKANMPDGLIRINIRHFAVTISRLVQYIDDIDTATTASWESGKTIWRLIVLPNQPQAIAIAISPRLPELFHAVPDGGRRFWEFFTVNIRNPNTRRAYFKAVEGFDAWCEERGLGDVAGVTPMHVAAYVEQLGRTHSKPTVKQHLAAIRMLFDWLVTGHIMETNPAHAVRGPKHSVRKGKTSVLSADEMRELLAAIDTTSLLGLRDRALIALMGYTFARVGAATGMKVQDFYVQKRRGWVRLHEKGGKVTELPCHHNLDQYLEEWIAASGLGTEPEAPLFPTLRYGRLTDRTSLPQANVHMMIQRRARAAGLRTKISAHSFRATGITTYLQNGGKLEIAQQMAGHESARTTGLYDRRNDEVALDEVERIAY